MPVNLMSLKRYSKIRYFNQKLIFTLVISKILFIYILERGRKGEKHQCVVASHMLPTGDLARNPDMCSRLAIKPATLWFAGQHSIH